MSIFPLRDALLEAARHRRTGAVAWTDTPKKRLYFLRDGELVAAQSNLKSEGADRARELDPTLAGPTLQRAVARARVRAALTETRGEVAWHADAAPQSPEPADLRAILVDLAELLPTVVAGWPRVATGMTPQVARFPADAPLQAYLADLDGQRPLEEVLAFAPAPPEATTSALVVLVALGLVEGAQTQEASGPNPVTTPAPAPPPPAAPAPALKDVAGMSIADLLADALGAPALPPAPVAASAPTPAAPAPDSAEARIAKEAARIATAPDHFAVLGVKWDDTPDVMRRAYFGLARGLHPDQLGDVDEASRARATDAFDKLRAAWEVLGDDTAREAYIARVIRGEKTEDELAMERVRVILDAESDFKRALGNFHAGRVQEAHQVFQKVVAAVPDSLEFLCWAAFTRMKLATDKAEIDAAFQDLSEAMRENETFDTGYVLLGMGYRIRGNDAVARRCFVKALKIKPANPDAAREMRRLERDGEEAKSSGGGFLGRLFGKK